MKKIVEVLQFEIKPLGSGHIINLKDGMDYYYPVLEIDEPSDIPAFNPYVCEITYVDIFGLRREVLGKIIKSNDNEIETIDVVFRKALTQFKSRAMM